MDGEHRIISERYEVKEILGSGGMADVLRAVDRRLGRDVALKLLLPAYARDPEFVERFRREARAAAALNHPNVVAVYDWGNYDGTPFMVMEYVAGPTLKDAIRDRGPLPEDGALLIAEEAASGLQAAHEHGLVHRDVKPHNILLAPDGRVKVADFGIAYAVGATQLTATNAVSGTAMYMSPEQVQAHPVDARSDVYSLGIVLYEMLTGMAPYHQGSMIEIALQHVNAPLPNIRIARPDLRPGTVAVLERALARSPADRYANAGELRAALEALKKRGSVSAPVPPLIPLPESSARTVIQPRAPVAASRVPVNRQPAHGIGARLFAVPLVIALIAIAALFTLHRSPQHRASTGPRTHVATQTVPHPTATRATVHHMVATRPARPPTQPPAATATLNPTTPATITPSTSTPGPVALSGPLGPTGTVQTFYADILNQNFAAARALWSANMQRNCDPVTCINQRFAATTAASVHLQVTSPPHNGQATVAVDLQEVNSNQHTHWVGSWNLIEQGGQWLLDNARFCRPGVDAGCAGN